MGRIENIIISVLGMITEHLLPLEKQQDEEVTLPSHCLSWLLASKKYPKHFDLLTCWEKAVKFYSQPTL